MSVEYDLDTSGGLMPQIQALIAPPVLEDSGGNKKKKDPPRRTNRRPGGRTANRESCDSCKEGGDLIFCDRCPAAFHFACNDPPIDEDDIPTGEWVCNSCTHASNANVASTSAASLPSTSRQSAASTSRQTSSSKQSASTNKQAASTSKQAPSTSKKQASEITDEALSPLDMLIDAVGTKNASQYEMPTQFVVHMPLPGTSKKNGPKLKGRRATHEFKAGLAHLPANLCYQCKKSCKHAPLIQCDYCPLLYHADCVDPPLTSLPVSRWMCPNHTEHNADLRLLSSNSLSSRVKLWDKFNGPVNQDAVKLKYLNKANRPNPPFRSKVKLPPRINVQVPGLVVQQYKYPPPILPRVRDPIPRSVIDDAPINEGEMTKWLGKLVQFQTEVLTRQLEIKKAQKAAYEIDTAEAKPADCTQLLDQPITTLSQPDTSTSEPMVQEEMKMEEDVKPETLASDNPETAFQSKGVTVNMATSSNFAQSAPAGSEQEFKPEALVKVIKYVSAEDPNREELQLDQNEEKLMRLCAYQFIKQVLPLNKENQTNNEGEASENSQLRARAILVPLDGVSENVNMCYRSMHLGLGAGNDLCFSRLGHCNYVSTKHATIFYDEYTKQYELLNYSCYGTIVDNVMYCSDISERRSQSPSALSSAVHRLYNSTPRLHNIPPPPTTSAGPSTRPRERRPPRRECQCQSNPCDIVQDCTGWEGTALLHHGSYIRCGCLQFVFSIVEYGYRFLLAQPQAADTATATVTEKKES